ncbi:ubiquitin carboxyl-terminal hydrolase 47-like [Eucyclogobius newberryi]|uniref:ubiquitin carboxyl-terminal hydrolase 47-like n=1 Tax=Eucyclogobius newberryi TaxID=166745 RepID=UPI003B5CECFE
MAGKVSTGFHQKDSPLAEKKYHGLVNQGVTDYLNSVLQVLFMTEDFRERVKRNNAGEEHIDKELRDLFIDLEEHVANTSKITTKLKITNVHEQRDAAEHYEKILRLTSPEASQIFHGELLNTNTCKKCNTKTESPAGFWQLPLPLVDNNNEYSVEKGIEDFFRSSEISGDDQMYCETCDEKCDAVLDCGVKHHPEVLVLLLKRFEFDYRYMTYVKVKQPVNVPNTLQISGNQSYELYALVEHSGELRYGHYISTIRSQDDGKWYQFNDSQVAPHKAPPALERSRSAYLLFYQKLKETPLNGTGDINETTEEDQDPDPNKPENEETPGSSARRRDGSCDEAEQEGEETKTGARF